MFFNNSTDAPETAIFTSNKANGVAVLGEKVLFTCNATSLPSASYEFLHNEVVIMNSTNHTFEIASVSLADEGTYRCIAYNYIGSSVVSSRNLTIHGEYWMLGLLSRLMKLMDRLQITEMNCSPDSVNICNDDIGKS